MPLTPSERETISRFHALYSGGHAQRRRDLEGNNSAMPPWTETYWMGKQVVKCPMDLWTYQEIIWETRPEVIIETGTSGGGSAWFFAGMLDLLDSVNESLVYGRVFTIDKDQYPELCLPHQRIVYFQGDSADESSDFVRIVRQKSAARRTMVSLDSLHTYSHVRRELELYAPLVSPGCYIVVEDTGFGEVGQRSGTGDWADRAALEFVMEHPNYVIDHSREKHMLTSNWNGWIRRES